MSQLTKNDVIRYLLNPKDSLELSLKQWSELIMILREVELLARFSYLISEQNLIEQLPLKVQQHLQSAQTKADRQAKQAIYEAEQLANNVKASNITPIFLKGVAYTLLNNKASLGRTYSDMDILVNKADLKTIERRLSLFGWFGKKSDDYDEKYYREWAHEIPPLYQASRGTVADIHHNLLPPISGKAPDIKMFTENTLMTKQGLLTLSKAGLVMHSIIHLFFNEDFSHAFRDITDLHLLFTEEDQKSEFWQELIELSIKSQFETELFYAVRYCQELTETHFPVEFLTTVNKAKPTTFKLTFSDFIFKQVLYPNHSSFRNWQYSIANFFAICRGHILKMPLHILLYHTAHKLYVQIFKSDNAADKVHAK